MYHSIAQFAQESLDCTALLCSKRNSLKGVERYILLWKTGKEPPRWLTISAALRADSDGNGGHDVR